MRSKAIAGVSPAVLATLVLLGHCGGTGSGVGSGPELTSRQAGRIVTGNNTITQAADELRTGWFPDQPGLDPSIVGGAGFKRIFQTTLTLVSGEQVYAEPLVNGSTVFVATENNNLYVLDAASGAILASRALGTPFNPSALGCGDLTPSVGITGTPVIDTTTNTAYLLAKVADANNNATWYFHAVDANSLAERAGFPVTVAGSAANDPAVTFIPQIEHQRPGLLLLNGVVYAGFGGHCDQSLSPTQPFDGWVVGLSTAGRITTMFVTEDHTANSGGIWQSGGGLVSDGPGRILFLTGNGWTSGTPLAGNAPPTTLGESFVQLQVQADNSLKAMQFFSPYNVIGDEDFSAGGPVALPDSYFGTTAFPHLAVAAGKLNELYVVDRYNLGGFEQGSSVDTTYNPPRNEDRVVSETTLDAGLWSRPAVWPGDGGWIYITSSGARFQALKYGLNGQGTPTFTISGRSSDVFNFSSGSPVVTSNSTNSGSALVWVTNAGGGGQPAQLRAYSAVPVNGTLNLVFSDTYGPNIKFTTPGVGAGRVYVGGYGTVTGYGSPASGPVSGNVTDFGTVVDGGTKTLSVSLTANQPITVTALASSNPAFTLGTAAPALPATLSSGQMLTVPVTFAPTTATTYTGQITATTSAGSGSVGVRGLGQVNGPQLMITPTSINFGTVATGTMNSVNALLSSAGSQALTFNGFALPSAPFTVSGLPAVGSSLASGASVAISVTYAPSANGNNSDMFVAQSTGANVTLPLSGAAGPPPKLSLSPLSLNYGDIQPGGTESLSFTLGNTGGSDLVIVKSKPPVLGQFQAQTSLPESTVVPAGSSVTETVGFSPTFAGAFSDQWIINTNDATTGLQTVQFVGSAGQTVPLSRTGWTATASVSNPGDVPSNAFDGNIGTRWSTGQPQAAGQSFAVDMQSTQTFTQVTLDAGNATDYPHGYQVYVSADGVNWGSPVATGAGSGEVTTIPVGQQSARYIRIVQTGTSASWWSIAELNVDVPNSCGTITALSRTGWLASAFMSNGGEGPANAIDGVLATRWSSGAAQANGQWFELDMLSPQTFCEITMDAAGNNGDYPHGYSVYVSNDGASWGTPVSSGAGTGQLVTAAFKPQTARYVRIVETANVATNWWSIAELNVYSTPQPAIDAGSGDGSLAEAGPGDGSAADGGLGDGGGGDSGSNGGGDATVQESGPPDGGGSDGASLGIPPTDASPPLDAGSPGTGQSDGEAGATQSQGDSAPADGAIVDDVFSPSAASDASVFDSAAGDDVGSGLLPGADAGGDASPAAAGDASFAAASADAADGGPAFVTGGEGGSSGVSSVTLHDNGGCSCEIEGSRQPGFGSLFAPTALALGFGLRRRGQRLRKRH